jgi:hypothetical protein
MAVRDALQPRRRETAGKSWTPLWRGLISLWLGLHLLAVFMPPFAFQTSPVRGLGSPVAELGMGWLRPYIEALYLNQGYAFFAPDPGPSHLLLARLTFADGRPPLEMRLPDLSRDWPRLLYHRHFMLSEHLHGAFAPDEPPPEMTTDAQREAWLRARELYRRRKAAIERQLKNRFNASHVELVRIEHRLLDPVEVVTDGKRLDDEDTYLTLPETGFLEGQGPFPSRPAGPQEPAAGGRGP